LPQKKVVAIIPEYSGNANEFNYLVTDNLSHWISKVVQITGKVTQVNEDGILLNGTIYCQFENKKDIQSIIENQNIVVKGKLVGFDELLMEIKLNQCIIIQ
jgi:UDP-N-acetylglucosamine transferase subunit ALG13